MQVFVPVKSLYDSAHILDNRRANNQINECNQIYRAAIGESKGWANHCITRLWKDDLVALMFFAWCLYFALIDKGKRPPTPYTKRVNGINVASLASNGMEDKIKTPHFVKLKWWTDKMKSHLLSKDFCHYSQFGWEVPVESGYYAYDKNGDWCLYSAR